jgi:adenylate kinase
LPTGFDAVETMRIIITGSPGTGKSTIAATLSKKLDVELIDIKKIVNQKKLCGKNHEVDLKALHSALRPFLTQKNYIVEGHLACEIKIPADFVLVLRTDPFVLKKRLNKRRYSKEKIIENLMAEMLDYCTQRVEKVYGKKPLEIDTSKRNVHSCVIEIEKAIKQKKKKLDHVNYSRQLKKFIGVFK